MKSGSDQTHSETSSSGGETTTAAAPKKTTAGDIGKYFSSRIPLMKIINPKSTEFIKYAELSASTPEQIK